MQPMWAVRAFALLSLWTFVVCTPLGAFARRLLILAMVMTISVRASTTIWMRLVGVAIVCFLLWLTLVYIWNVARIYFWWWFGIDSCLHK